MTKFQIYSHYKLPISKDPLKYGKLMDQINNKYIVQLTTKNVAIIEQFEKENFIKIFKNGDLVLEFKDKFTSDTSFIRYIDNTRFLFENDKLISTQILSRIANILIYMKRQILNQLTPLNKMIYLSMNPLPMNKYFLIILIVVIALLSVIILITFKSLNKLILFTTFSINIMSLYFLIYQIESIELNVWTISLILIIINNIFLAFTHLVYNNKYLNEKIKVLFAKMLQNYIKFIFIYPNYILSKTLGFISNKLIIFNNRLNNKIFNFIAIEPLKLLNKEFNEDNKAFILTFENNNLLDHQNLFRALFTGVMLQPEFMKPGKKIMIVSICNEDRSFYIHKNIIVDENTTVYNYIEKIQNSIHIFYESGYPLHIFNILQVKFWDIDPLKSSRALKNNKKSIHPLRRDFHSSCLVNKTDGLNLIKPLKIPQVINRKLIATMDIETVEFNGIQYPICLTFAYYLNNQLITIVELIDYNLFLNNQERAIKILWINFMDKLNNLKLKNCVIFSHNLGSFDGYFIYKGLLDLPDIDINNVTSIIDDLHRFINIQLSWKDNKFIFKDSLRVFPVSLKDLGGVKC
jgi:hypothetical protein